MAVRTSSVLKVLLALITCCSAAVHATASEIHYKWINEAPSPSKKSPCTFIFVHGLYGDNTQFSSYADAFEMFGCSSIMMTLPGHGADSENAEKITGRDWIKFLDTIVSQITKVSEHTYLVGQSTGGALAAVMAHRQSLSSGRKGIDGLWLIEPALRVRSGPGLGSCLFSVITNDVRQWPRTAGLFGVEIKANTPKLSPRMGCQVDSIWKDHLIETGLLNRDSAQGYYDLIEATQAAFGNLKIPTYIQNTIGDRMVDAKFIKQTFGNMKSVRYMETNSPKHGQVIVDNVLPGHDIENLVEVGFPMPKIALDRHARNLLEAVHFYRRAAEGDSERKENMLEFLVKYRNLTHIVSTPACETYVSLVDSSRTTDQIIPEFNACMISLQR